MQLWTDDSEAQKKRFLCVYSQQKACNLLAYWVNIPKASKDFYNTSFFWPGWTPMQLQKNDCWSTEVKILVYTFTYESLSWHSESHMTYTNNLLCAYTLIYTSLGNTITSSPLSTLSVPISLFLYLSWFIMCLNDPKYTCIRLLLGLKPMTTGIRLHS